MKLTCRVYGDRGSLHGRQWLAELGLVRLAELVERRLVATARVGPGQRTPGLREIGVDLDRALEPGDAGRRGSGLAQQQRAEQVERPRVVGIGGQRAVARRDRRAELAHAEVEVAARRDDAR